MAWFKSKEQDKDRIAIEAARAILQENSRGYEIRKTKEQSYDKFLAKVIITPETQEQYEKRVGHAVELIDVVALTNNNIGVIFSKSSGLIKHYYDDPVRFKKHLVEAGIEAVVNANFTEGNQFYGLPVARKKGGPYRT